VDAAGAGAAARHSATNTRFAIGLTEGQQHVQFCAGEPKIIRHALRIIVDLASVLFVVDELCESLLELSRHSALRRVVISPFPVTTAPLPSSQPGSSGSMFRTFLGVPARPDARKCYADKSATL